MFVKKFFILAISLLLLTSCKPVANKDSLNNDIDYEFSIISPSGAPALSLLDFIDDETITYEIVDGSDILAAEFSSGEKDFIIAPINLGMNLINKGSDYTLVSVLTWGNLYLVSTNEHLNSDKVAAFGEAAVPGKIISTIESYFEGVQIDYFASVQEVSSALLSGQYDTAILAEPFLTMTKNQWSSTHGEELNEIANIQEIYSGIKGQSSYPQAALFVKTSLLSSDLEAVMSFANRMDSSIDKYNNNESALNERIDEIDLSLLGFANKDLIKQSYSRIALDFVYAYDCVDSVNTFLDLFGIELKSSTYIK